MSVIKSLDEWWEAFEAKRLEYFNGATWGREQSGNLSISSVMASIEAEHYRWKQEELTLVEYAEPNTTGPFYWFEDTQLPTNPNWIKTGRIAPNVVIKGADDE